MIIKNGRCDIPHGLGKVIYIKLVPKHELINIKKLRVDAPHYLV